MYADGTYLNSNPQWHSGDSQWKASQISKMLTRNWITPQTVCEVGCGAGEVLIELARGLPEGVHFDGYEVSPDAYAICEPKSTVTIKFHLEDMLEKELAFDVVLAI